MIFLLLAALLSPPNAHALFCTSLKELKKKVFHCEQNDHYAEAAIYCLENFEKEAKLKATALGEALGLSPGKKDVNQSSGRGENALDLAKSKIEIAALLLEAIARHKEVEDYGRNVNFPEDFDNPKIVKKNPEKFLEGSQCYKRAAIAMESVLEEFEKQISQLKQLQALIDTLLKRNTGSASLDGETKAASGKKTGESTPKKKKKKGNAKKLKDSDVTGLQEEEAKQEDTRKILNPDE